MKTTQEQIAVMQHFADGGQVEMQYADGTWKMNDTPQWEWWSINYRIAEEVDPYAELKAAAADPTKQIRCSGNEWVDAGEFDWKFNSPIEEYQIRFKPKPLRKVKLLAWFTEDSIAWLIEGKQPVPYWNWKRVPGKDMEIEVEE